MPLQETAIPSAGKGGRQRDPPMIGTNYTGEEGEREGSGGSVR